MDATPEGDTGSAFHHSYSEFRYSRTPLSYTCKPLPLDSLMHCPSCNHKLSYLAALKIVNPFKHKCQSCGTHLTLGQQGAGFVLGSVILGGSLAGIGIYLEQSGCLTARESLLAFATSFFVTAGIGEYFCWKHGVFKLARKAEIAPK
jgi:hypothetical protein